MLGSGRRGLTAALALLLAIPLLAAPVLAAPVLAEPPVARGIDRVCPAPEGEFPDQAIVDFPDVGTTHADAITCAAGYGLVSGFLDGTFRPAEPITRGQMAAFVAAWIERATGFELPLPDELVFNDVEDSTHVDAIVRIAEAGIVSGRGDGTFGPGEPLTRGQFTRAVANAISYADVFRTGGPLPPVGEEGVTFPDIAGSTFEEDIRALAGVGIALGQQDGAFAPSASVTRGQLATFLLRSADYLDRHQRWKPTASTAILTAELRGVEAVVEPAPDGNEDAATPDGESNDDEGDPQGDEEPDGGGTEGENDPDTGAAADNTNPKVESDTSARPTAAPSGLVLVTLTVNAFNGSLGYLAELSGLPGPIDDDAVLEVWLGAPGEDDGRLVLTLAEGPGLEESRRGDGFAAGTVTEGDSAIRLADLTLRASDVTLELRGSQLGRYRGTLERVR